MKRLEMKQKKLIIFPISMKTQANKPVENLIAHF